MCRFLQIEIGLFCPLSYGASYYFFLAWLPWLESLIPYWIEVLGADNLFMLPILEQKLLCFAIMMFHRLLHRCPLTFWGTFLCVVCWVVVFFFFKSQRDVEFCQIFLASIEMIIFFLPFILLKCVLFVDSYIPNQSCFPGLIYTCSWCIILCVCPWIQIFSILLRILSFIFISFFFPLWCHWLVLVSEKYWPHRMSCKMFPLLFL